MYHSQSPLRFVVDYLLHSINNYSKRILNWYININYAVKADTNYSIKETHKLRNSTKLGL